MQDNRGKEATASRILQHAVLEPFGHKAHVVRLVFHAHGPEWEPAKARFQYRKAEIGIAIEPTSAKERTHGPHGAPGMRSAAPQEGIAPEVAVARVTLGEAVVDETQSLFVYRLPDRMQVRMVQRVVNRQANVHTNGPRRATPVLDLRH